ncbi:hypothetical protein EPJ70_09590 [Brachyspira aalborgi]|uniref:Uncharacterized protein n=1 Tax=Brachyspira aalborgi TaxID=29522 RepID=A0A5C8F4N5_9SPIR|nr:hypothetical protein [Brachyspira aalborgi]TXJ44459.1 hypothetical protein EPJ70_09590 [Brachyspira aalborgi]
MTKKILILLVVVISIITIGAKESKQAKNQKSYETRASFYYSDDAGKTYGSSRKEFKVGETVYMKVVIEITEKKPANTVAYIGGGSGLGAGVGAAAGAAATVAGAGAATGAAAGAAAGAPFGPLLLATSAGGAVVGALVGLGLYFFAKPSLDFVECELTIPNITSVDAKYYDGIVITPLKDEAKGITTYPLKIKISDKKIENLKNSEEYFTFRFIPNKESEITTTLIFDDNIAEEYNKINTIKFVK